MVEETFVYDTSMGVVHMISEQNPSVNAMSIITLFLVLVLLKRPQLPLYHFLLG